MKKQQTVKEPSRLEQYTASVAKDWAHQNSVVIHSRVRVLQFEASEVDTAIVMLSAALARQKERRAMIDATLKGLAQVVDKR